MNKYIQYLILILLCSIFAVSFIVSEKLTDTFIYPKWFYFIFSTLITSIFIFSLIIFIKGHKTLNINQIDLIFIIYAGYTIVNYFITKSSGISQEIIMLILLVFIYFVIKFYFQEVNHSIVFKLFIFVLIFFCFIQASIGILQFSGIITNENFPFKTYGTIGNPGGLTNYLVSTLPLSFGVILFIRKESVFNTILIIISILSFVSAIFVIIVCDARTAWIAAFIGIMLTVNHKYLLLKKLYQRLKTNLLRACVIIVILGIGIATGYKLYILKKDSSLGRLFIWETTIDIIKEKPIFGTGYKTFFVEHNKKQADYFKNTPDDKKRGYLADNVSNAFNDYLEICAELGLVGLLLFLTLVIRALSSKPVLSEENKYLCIIFKISLALILVTGLFSYPLFNISIHLNLVAFFAVISSFDRNNLTNITLNKVAVKVLALFGLLVTLYIIKFEYTRFNCMIKWKKASWYANVNKTENALLIYKDIYPVLRDNGNFLYNYGIELSLAEYYNESLKILKEAEVKFNDADFYLYLGNTYEGLNMFNEAEQAFKYANLIVPHKIYPDYRLVLLYEKTGRIDEAVALAKKIIQHKSKVKSDITDEIKTEMVRLINKNN